MESSKFFPSEADQLKLKSLEVKKACGRFGFLGNGWGLQK